MNPRILILDSSACAGLAVVRSIGEAGCEVHVARIRNRSNAEHSRHCSHSLDLGDPSVDLQVVTGRLLDLVSHERYDLLIPTADSANELCASFRDSLESRIRLAMPPPNAYPYAHDKARLLELAERLDIPFPEYVTLRGFDDLPNARSIDLGWPCYVKPIHSVVATPERIVRFEVRRARDRNELIDLARFHLGRVPIMIQRFCPGIGVGVHILAWKGRLLSVIQQRRLHEPLHGGGGSYRITEPLDPMLAAYAQRFVEASGWSGVAMLEFKRDLHSNRMSLMEVNGRFWGSLPLTIHAGLDYPLWLVRLYLEGPDALPSPLPEPKLHVRQRHLGHDVVWAARHTLREPHHLGALLGWIREFRHVIDRSEAWDTERANDFIPAIAEWWQDVRRMIAPIRLRATRIIAQIVHPLSRRRRGLRVLDQVRGRAPRVLFVCAGNICRSPFAEYYMRQCLGYAEVRSVGTLQFSNRLVPETVEHVARERLGVDLTSHRSSTLTREAIEWADIALAMDHTNLVELYGQATLNTPRLLLGDLEDGRVVHDPLGCDDATIERTFIDIAALLETLHKRLVVTEAATQSLVNKRAVTPIAGPCSSR
jgi:protein-tyrosine-phosphatase/predicted ATP-grasp superfamily ATP-dependent carboligase